MSNEVEEFLAHYGVKGMKWGVRRSFSQRKAEKLKKYGGRNRKTRTRAQKNARAKRSVKRVNTALTVTAGALFVSDILRNSSRGARPNMKNYTKPSNSVKEVINRERKVKIDAIDKTFREGFIDKQQRDQFINAMEKRYDRKVAEALKNAAKGAV